MLTPEQRQLFKTALDAATASLKNMQAVLRMLEPYLVDEPDPPPPWWQALGLSDPGMPPKQGD